MAVAKVWDGSQWVVAIVGAKGDKGDPGIAIDEGSGAADGDILVYDANWDLWVPQAAPTPQWQDFTPTRTNFTVGNGTEVARYVQNGKTVFGYYQLTFGSTTVINDSPKIAAPVAVSSNIPSGYQAGTVQYNTTAALYQGVSLINSGDIAFSTFYPDLSGFGIELITSLDNFAYGATDTLFASFQYEAA